MLPYVPSIVAMIIMSRRAAYPKALLVPFRRGERISQIKMSMFENIQRGSDAFPRDESGMSTIDCSVIQLMLLALAVELRS